MDEVVFIRLVGAAEKDSEHPLAEAIVSGIIAKRIELPATEQFGTDQRSSSLGIPARVHLILPITASGFLRSLFSFFLRIEIPHQNDLQRMY